MARSRIFNSRRMVFAPRRGRKPLAVAAGIFCVALLGFAAGVYSVQLWPEFLQAAPTALSTNSK